MGGPERIHVPTAGPQLEEARHRYLGFLQKCQAPDGSFRLTPADL